MKEQAQQINIKPAALKRIGGTIMGTPSMEEVYINLHDAVQQTAANLPFDEAAAMIDALPNEPLRVTMQEKVAKIRKDPKTAEAEKTAKLAEQFVMARHGQILASVGEKAVRGNPLLASDTHPEVNYGLLKHRAERLMIPAQGMTFTESAKRQADARNGLELEEEGTIYATPQSIALEAKLRDAGYPEAAIIPWMVAEAPMKMSEETKKRMETFMGTVAVASSFIRESLINPAMLAETMKLDPEKRTRLGQLAETIKATLTWKIPDQIPQPFNTPGLKVPLVFSRPDFARELDSDGSVSFVATELENSPGGTGMMQILFAGYDIQPDLQEKMHQFMQTTEVAGNEAQVDRNRLTVLMTEDWAQYRQEIEIFLKKMGQDQGVDTDVVTIEELANLPAGEREKRIESGFVYHFAYSWNFFKDPEHHYLQLLRTPAKVADALGLTLENVLKIDPAHLDTEVARIEHEVKGQFLDTLSIPMAFMEEQYVRRLYRDDILTTTSQKEGREGQNLQTIGATLAENMAQTAASVYQRQGQDLVIFNDPAMGVLLNTKVGLSVYHLPGFSEFFGDYLAYQGKSPEEVEQALGLLDTMIADTAPLAIDSENQTLREFSQERFDIAAANKEDWVIKLSVDPRFGSFDWGARSLIAGMDVKSDEEWREVLEKAAGSNLPWALQRRIVNARFDQPREERTARSVAVESRERVGVFVRDPDATRGRFDIGELVASDGPARVNLFLFTDVKDGEVKGNVGNGMVTIRVQDGASEANRGRFQKIHGETGAAMIPLL